MTKVIKEETIRKTTYIAEDGTEFSSSHECEAYESKYTAEINKVKFSRIFGEKIEEVFNAWFGLGAEWYIVKIATEQDLVDFFALTKKY